MMRNFLHLFCIFCILACNTSDISISQPSQSETDQVQPLGDSLALKLLKALKNELSQAIQEKDAVNAIQVCNVKALSLTQTIAQKSPFPVDIKRVTNKLRNPKNKADEAENSAIEYFLELQKGNLPLPDFYIQKIANNKNTYFNYYKPLKINALCLTCHGNPATMDQSLKNVLKRLYPNDMATGYQIGDFRGLLRISFDEKYLKMNQ